MEGNDQFHTYVLPVHGITTGATAVNKLSVKHGILFYDGRPVTATSLDDGIAKFLDWLKPKRPCLLLARNAKGFDAKHLIRALTLCGRIDQFCQTTV